MKGMQIVPFLVALSVFLMSAMISPAQANTKDSTSSTSNTTDSTLSTSNATTSIIAQDHHHHKNRGHGFGSVNTLGTMTPFQCGSEPVSVFFTNIGGNVFVGTTVNNTGSSCSVAGVTWSGLNGTPLNRISFDDLGPPCGNDEVFALFSFVDLTSPPSTLIFACSELIHTSVGNNFTRYFISSSTPIPPGVSSVTFAHFGNTLGPTHHTFGNFLLNGSISPTINASVVTPCPSFINCPK